jgi:hypothetical protein
MGFQELDRALEKLPEISEMLREMQRRNLEPDEVLNTKGAARVLCIGEEEVRELASIGVLPGVVNGNGWKFSRRDLLCWNRLSGREGIKLRAAQIDFETGTLRPGPRRTGSTLEQMTGVV